MPPNSTLILPLIMKTITATISILFLIMLLCSNYKAATGGLLVSTQDGGLLEVNEIISPPEAVAIDFYCLDDIPVDLRVAIALAVPECEIRQELQYIAFHESTYNIHAQNPTSSAYGAFQFLYSSWNYLCDGDRYNVNDQVICSAKLIREGKAHSTWYAWW